MYFAYCNTYDIVSVSLTVLLAFVSMFFMESDFEFIRKVGLHVLEESAFQIFYFSRFTLSYLHYHDSWFLYDLILCWRYGTFEYHKISVYACHTDVDWQLQLNRMCMSCDVVCLAFVHKRQDFLDYHRSHRHYVLYSHQIASPLVSRLDKNITAVKIWSKLKQLDKKTVSDVHVEFGTAGHVQTSAISKQTCSTSYSWCWKSFSNGLAIRINLLCIRRSAYTFSPAEDDVVLLA